jgi:hypothetical protein
MERNRQEELTDAPHRTHRDSYRLPYMHTTYRMKAPGEQRRDPKIAAAELALQKTAAKFRRSSSLRRKVEWKLKEDVCLSVFWPEAWSPNSSPAL